MKEKFVESVGKYDWLVFLCVEVKIVFEKVLIDTWMLLNFIKDGYLIIFVCYSCKVYNFWGLTVIVETSCISW